MGDHHGRAAERASPLVRATDEIFGTHNIDCVAGRRAGRVFSRGLRALRVHRSDLRSSARPSVGEPYRLRPDRRFGRRHGPCVPLEHVAFCEQLPDAGADVRLEPGLCRGCHSLHAAAELWLRSIPGPGNIPARSPQGALSAWVALRSRLVPGLAAG